MVNDIELLLTALTEAGVRYIVVGGVAVVLHGYLRATADLDLILAMDEQNLQMALRTFGSIGFNPRAPVPLAAFADASERRRWSEEKNLQVFSLWHSKMPGFEVDLFVESPLPFDGLYSRAVRVDIGRTTVSIAAISDLIAMKRAAGRPRDVEDIEALLHLQEANDKRSD
jgi:predicted nucleotidyltransferase